MIENLHTHTVRCGHAQGAEEEYVRSAIAAGFQVLGFSDHTPHPFPGGYRSKVRMTMDELSGYVDSIGALKAKYRDQIRIPIGLEAEYYPALFDELLIRCKDAGIEYMILGQHYLDNEYDQSPLRHTFHATGDEADLIKYCRQTMAGIQTGVFTYLCHPDVVNFVGDTAIYDRHMRRLCQEAKSCGLPLEINLWGMLSNKHYPLPRFWELAAEEGCQVVLGSDAHRPDVVNNVQCQARALQMVKELGLELLDHIPLKKLR